jgi:hypothetical protein
MLSKGVKYDDILLITIIMSKIFENPVTKFASSALLVFMMNACTTPIENIDPADVTNPKNIERLWSPQGERVILVDLPISKLNFAEMSIDCRSKLLLNNGSEKGELIIENGKYYINAKPVSPRTFYGLLALSSGGSTESGGKIDVTGDNNSELKVTLILDKVILDNREIIYHIMTGAINFETIKGDVKLEGNNFVVNTVVGELRFPQ